MTIQILIVMGASVFALLGCVHLVYTLFGNKFEAFDPAVSEAMKNSSPVISKDTSMWKAWIGFNISHSLGAILLAGFYIPLTLNNFEVIRDSLWFSNLPLVVGLIYLGLAKKYWFNIPFLGILLATLCFLAASIGINL